MCGHCCIARRRSLVRMATPDAFSRGIGPDAAFSWCFSGDQGQGFIVEFIADLPGNAGVFSNPCVRHAPRNSRSF